MFKSVDTRTTTATRAGCARRGLGRNPHFSRRGGPVAEDDLRLTILQLNTYGFTAFKISVFEQLAYKNKALVIVLH